MKKYSKPEMKVIKLRSRARLLVGSDPDDVYNERSNGEQL